jgi:hypothetical protein
MVFQQAEPINYPCDLLFIIQDSAVGNSARQFLPATPAVKQVALPPGLLAQPWANLALARLCVPKPVPRSGPLRARGLGVRRLAGRCAAARRTLRERRCLALPHAQSPPGRIASLSAPRSSPVMLRRSYGRLRRSVCRWVPVCRSSSMIAPSSPQLANRVSSRLRHSSYTLNSGASRPHRRAGRGGDAARPWISRGLWRVAVRHGPATWAVAEIGVLTPNFGGIALDNVRVQFSVLSRVQ